MATQLSTDVRDAMMDAIESTIGTAAKLQIRTGSAPANPAAADTGSLLVEMDLPSDWLGASSSGVKSKSGTWSGTASGTGTAGHFRIKDSTGTDTGIQGTVTATGGGGDITVDNASIATGQAVTVNTFTLTAPNA
jgi:hypothetical protein